MEYYLDSEKEPGTRRKKKEQASDQESDHAIRKEVRASCSSSILKSDQVLEYIKQRKKKELDHVLQHNVTE